MVDMDSTCRKCMYKNCPKICEPCCDCDHTHDLFKEDEGFEKRVTTGLSCCATMTASYCEQCPYSYECKEITGSGVAHLAQDANTLIDDLKIEINELKRKLEVLRPKLVKIAKDEIGLKCYYCPTCNEGILRGLLSNPLYCRNCGQALEWDDE